MLVNIHVKNMALIREADIHLGRGLNILTGETGAGKSIMMGAVNVALGLQGFKGFAREDADYALAELVFVLENEELIEAVRALEIPVTDGEVIVTRRMMNGRSISKINGETVPISTVKKISSVLLDIHGQHENQTLLHSRKHLEVLDDYAGEVLQTEMEAYVVLYKQYRKLLQELEEAKADGVSRVKEIDFLQFELQEIEAANLRDGEDVELENEFKRLSHVRKIKESLYSARNYMNDNGMQDAAGRALSELSQIVQYDETLKSLYDQLLDIDDLLNDFNREMAEYAEGLTYDEADLAGKEERLNLMNHLKHKFGDSIPKIMQYYDEKSERMQKLQNYEEYLASLEKNCGKCRSQLQKQADILTKIRKEQGFDFAKTISAMLKELNFLDVRFEVAFQELADFGAAGKDEVCFMISTNPGQPLRPVQDTASGGELSRIMLAIKAAMADKDQVETLIFDEIDSGISGRTAQMVSEKLALIASKHQVICITHLAQIAAMADSHFIIEKCLHDGMTETTIRRLDDSEMIGELARILGGSKITNAVMENAAEMKKLAKNTSLK